MIDQGGLLMPLDPSDQDPTHRLSSLYGLSIRHALEDWVWGLRYEHDRLVLHTQAFSPFSLDYHSGSWSVLASSVRCKKPALASAMGGSISSHRVLDLTLGWGRDAFMLSILGATVMGVEQHKAVSAMVQDALRHAPFFSMVSGDSAALLSELMRSFRPTVLVMDPMFDLRKKKALVQKRMQVLQHIHEAPSFPHALFDQARSMGIRLVVKGAPSAHMPSPPSFEIKQKTMKLSVYLPK